MDCHSRANALLRNDITYFQYRHCERQRSNPAFFQMNFIWDSSGNKFSMTKRINRHFELTRMCVELKRNEIFCSNSEIQNLFNNQQTNTAISSQLLLAFPYLFWNSPAIRSYIFQTPITISIKTIVFYFFFGSIMTCRQKPFIFIIN